MVFISLDLYELSYAPFLPTGYCHVDDLLTQGQPIREMHLIADNQLVFNTAKVSSSRQHFIFSNSVKKN